MYRDDEEDQTTAFDSTSIKPLTLVDILRWRALHEPEREAYTFLLDGETKKAQMTYADLDRQARRIAFLLQDRLVPGERVLLLYPPGLEYVTAVFACFYAGVVAVPAYPPRLNQSLIRIKTIFQDAQATAALTTLTILSSLRHRFALDPLMQDLHWIGTDTMTELVAAEAEQAQGSALSASPPEALALLQYTSGSTSSPKGVMLTHANLMQNAALIQEGMSLTSHDRGMFWLPPYHDMGLMGGILQALYTGYPSVLMAPATFLQQPLRWLQALSSFHVTVSGGPNFAYDLCVKKATPDIIKALDLSHWTVAFTGAEPVRAETLESFAQRFADSGFRTEAFYPCYGLAETTLFVSGGHRPASPDVRTFDRHALETGLAIETTGNQESGHLLVSCGHVRQRQEVTIVDPEKLTRCAPGTIGEIWVKSPNIGQGYWGKEEETAETFQAFLEDAGRTAVRSADPRACPTGEGPFLRTGDLGFCVEKELYITGRLKDVIIIRGRNLYPQDIELAVEKSHPLLRQSCCAVFAVEGAHSEQVVVVQEVVRHYDDQEVQEAIQAICQVVLSEFDVEIAAIELLRAGTIPKTTSGKIQRSACRSRFLAGELNAVYRWNRTQKYNKDVGELASPTRKQAFTPKLQEIIEWLVTHIAQHAHIDARIIDIHAPFVQFGLNSLEAIGLSGELEQWLGRSTSPTLIYDYPSIDALARYMAGEDPAVETDLGTHQHHTMQADAIAIIGLGCRFPGANNPPAFWQMLHDGINAISLVPETRWDVTKFYVPDQAIPGKMNTRWGGFLQEVEQFDPSFFALSPREATRMDPQQRLLLEVAWETLENAGQAPDMLAGSQTGVFIGISSDDYSRLHLKNPEQFDAYAGTGNAHSIAANRLSYTFDLHGPSIAIDTACSSSLVAVHQACQSLRNGECDLALAGGVNVILEPSMTITFSQARMMSSDGHCKTFDEAADGYVRGEGCGLVLLKPLGAAERDGDTILAIIRGSAVNQDGRSNGLTAPHGPSQEAVIRRALQNAAVHPDDISYIETHGSSTPLGDPIEIDALKAVFMQQRNPDKPCLLGAVKTNIGHLEAASGIAGLIKTVLCLQKGVIVPNLHFQKLNPHISFAGTTFEIPAQQPRPWPSSPDAQRFAGISAFGFGGTNAHVILEGAPQERSRRDRALRMSSPHAQEETGTTGTIQRSMHLLTLSGRTTQALQTLAQRYLDFLAAHPTVSFSNLCATTNAGRTHFAHRLAVRASNTEQLRERLAAFVTGQPPKEMQVGSVGVGQAGPALAFLFTGQGSQYAHMAHQLYETQPTFRKVLDECDRLLRPYLDQLAEQAPDRHKALSLRSVLYPASGATSLIGEAVYLQPALFALEYALAQMWLSWGVKPAVVMGHSLGEYVAACVAGLFSLEDGLKLITARARLMQSLPEHGTMAIIFAEPERIQAFIEPYKQYISIAALNGPQQTVISGREEIVQLVMQRLETEGVRTHSLAVLHAFHSPLMDPMLDVFEQVASEVNFAPLRIPLVCNLTGQLIPAGETLDAPYWRRHTREAVQFATGIQTLSVRGYELFLEIGPTPMLSNLGKRCLPVEVGSAQGTVPTWLSSLHQGHDDWHIILQSIASLYYKGCNLNWSSLNGEYHKIALPTYPFEREYCWFKSEETDEDTATANAKDHHEMPQVQSLDAHVAVDHISGQRGIDFGLIFFSSNEAASGGEDYRLVIESARYADQYGFSSVWIPERHFTKDGWLYPNPAVLLAALARETSRIHLRAGSVVVPLHNPLRIAEDWAMVDKLSGGRVGISFASGWHPNDFSLAPENYADRNEVMYRNIEIVRKLWRGETVPFRGGDGKLVELKTYPSPMQENIPLWLTAAGNPKTFAGAGRLGANLLTHMYNQSIDELAEKIHIYRNSRAEHGYDPATGKVSVMLHTYVGADMETVRAQIQEPFSDYLKSASYLVNAIAYSRGQQVNLATLTEQDLQDYLVFVTDRLIREQRVLFGTPQTCTPLVTQLQAAGVDEIACQMDFGIDTDLVLKSLPYLTELRDQCNINGVLEVRAAQSTAPTSPTLTTKGELASPVRSTDNRKRALQALEHASEGEHHAILTAYVRAQVANVLHISAPRLDNEQPLTTLGFDSLMAIELKNSIELDLQIHIPIVTLLQGTSITQLVDQLLTLGGTWRETSRSGIPTHYEKAEVNELREGDGWEAIETPASTLQPLSHNQKALWFLFHLAPESAAYNVLYAARIQQWLDVAALRRALRVLANRYSILTSTYTLHNGEPAQQNLPNQFLPLEEIDASSASLDDLRVWLQEESNRPIDLESGPVFRLILYRRTDDDYILGFIVHHIVADFWALEILVDELSLLYTIEKTDRDTSRVQSYEPLRPDFQNTDYVRWQRSMLESQAGTDHWQYWQNALVGDFPVLSLPTDRPRPPAQTYKGASHGFALSADLVQRLRIIANAEKVTLFTLMFTAYQVILHRYSNQDDILIGTPTLGRAHSELAGVIGYLANPVVVRARMGHNPTFKDLLHQTECGVLAALEHQDFPFPLLVERLQPHRDPSYSPIYQAAFTWNRPRTRNGEVLAHPVQRTQGTWSVPALSLEPFAYGQQGAPFDLTLTIFEIEGQLSADFRYNVDLFDASTMARMATHFLTLLDSIINNPDQHLTDLPLLSKHELDTIINKWNNTNSDYAVTPILHQLIETQVEKTPEQTALIFEGQVRTYRELNNEANQLAHQLQAIEIKPDTPVGICMERSLEMVVSLLAVLKAGGAYVPLDPNYPQERLAYMIQDAQVAVILTQSHLRERLPVEGSTIMVIDPDWHVEIEGQENNPVSAIQPDHQAYIIYTSGSTGKPKGVMNTHRGICNRLHWMQQSYQLTHEDRIIQKTPFSFDVSVWEFFWPLLTGATLVVARPGGHQDPDYIVNMIEKHLITVLHFVPSMLQAFLWEEHLEQRCRSLKHVICSGEALPVDLAKCFFAHVAEEVQLHNLYGPTEAAVDVTCWSCQYESDIREGRRMAEVDLLHEAQGSSTGYNWVPIGHPIANIQIYLLDRNLHPVPIGVTGELYIGGVGLARGYAGRPELTAERFIPNPSVGTGLAPVRVPTVSGERLYRTGDLARYRADGAIEYLGRIDSQVKIRGFRIELGEIEAALLKHPAVKDVAVLMREDSPGNKRLTAYIAAEDSQKLHTSELRRYLQEKLPEYMVPAIFVLLETLPRTTNGKLDRVAIRLASTVPGSDRMRSDRDAAMILARTPTEEVMASIWASVLGREQVGIYENFFVLGGDSIRSIQVLSRARERGIHFSLQQLFQRQTIAELVQVLGAETFSEHLAKPLQAMSLISPQDQQRLPADVEDAYPLTMLQAGMVFHSESDSRSAIYHDIFSFHLEVPMGQAYTLPDLLQTVLDQLAAGHPILRTSFDLSNFSEPLQLVYRSVKIPVEIQDLRRLSPTKQEEQLSIWLEEEKSHPFVWTRPPLLRFQIHLRSEASFQLTVSFHHAILDGWSVASLLTELMKGYLSLLSGDDATFALPTTMLFRDFVALERKLSASQETKQYWHEILHDAISIRLPRWTSVQPTDNPSVYMLPVFISDETGARLKRMAQEIAVPLKSMLLAVHLRVLSFLHGQPDIITGLVSNGRPEMADTERTLGVFLNTLPFRLKLSGGTWIELIQATFAAECQLLPYRWHPLIEIQQQQGGKALFETLFNFVHFHVYQEVLDVGKDTSPFSLQVLGHEIFERTNFTLAATFSLDPISSQIHLSLSCDTQELCLEQVKAIGGYYAQALVELAAEPYRHYEWQTLLSVQEREQLLVEWNATSCDHQGFNPWHQGLDPWCPQDLYLHNLFEQQVDRTPEAIALIFEEQHLTYAELNTRANQLAHYLHSMGIGPDSLVGLCMDRSCKALIGLLGILKAGGAYVPLDKSYPLERLMYMFQNAQLSWLVTQQEILTRFPQLTSQETSLFSTLCLDQFESSRALQQQPIGNPSCMCSPDQLAYVMYTSGSTGHPKGVAQKHRSLVNLLSWQQHSLPLLPGAVVLQFAPLSFDVSCQELFSTWLSGGSLLLISDELRRDPETLLHVLALSSVERIFVPPVVLQQLALIAMQGSVGELCLHDIITAGEQLRVTQPITTWIHQLKDCRLHNHYGPTETHVVTTYTLTEDTEQWSQLAPIGSPIANTQIYLLDAQHQLVPLGVPGDLYIGGESLARGYLHHPDLTAERFIPNPFSTGIRLYHTGDLARYRPDGTIEFLGRIDQQIKLRGFRIELGEIEMVLGQHPEVRVCAVVLRDEDAIGKYLIAYVVTHSYDDQSGTQATQLQEYLRKHLPDYIVPTSFIFLKTLPLSVNGKVDRKALPVLDSVEAGLVPALHEDTEIVLPQTPLQEQLARIWAELLHSPQMGIHHNFFELGGHSLLVTQVVARIRQTLQVDLPLRDLFEAPTIAQLSVHLEELMSEAPSPYDSVKLEGSEQTQGKDANLLPTALGQDRCEARGTTPTPMERPSDLPLSFAQERLWFLYQWAPDSAWYNVPMALCLSGKLHVQALEYCLGIMVQRHEILRTTFDERAGRPVQRIALTLPIEMPMIDLRGLATAERDRQVTRLALAEGQKPFDLSLGPLLRVCLLRTGASPIPVDESEHVFLLTLHHIVCDGWSMGVLVREMATLYQAEINGLPGLRSLTHRPDKDKPCPLPELPIQYADYALWQRQWLQGDVLDAQMAYWKKQLVDVPPLELPTDHLRPAVKTDRGAVQSRLLPPAFYQDLLCLCQQQDVTLFMLLLASFQVLLLRYTGQTDLCVGTPIANRTRAELEGLIGCFVNTLVLRTDLSGNPTFEGVLRRVREVCLEAYNHQDIPFEKVVEVLTQGTAPAVPSQGPAVRDTSRTPLFQVMLVLNDISVEAAQDLVEVSIRPLTVDSSLWTGPTGTSKFDLTLSFIQTKQGREQIPSLQCILEYSSDLFEASTIARMLNHWYTLLQGILQNPQTHVADLPLLTEDEQASLLVGMQEQKQDCRGSLPAEPNPPLLDICVHQLVEHQVKLTPDAIAVVFEQASLTYWELNARANHLAHHLRQMGVGSEEFVGVCMERSLELVIALLGILKAGGAYVPLDPSYPQERLSYMLEDAQISVVITQAHLRDLMGQDHKLLLMVESISLESGTSASDLMYNDVQNQGNPPCRVLPDNLAYLIYTSGSAGKPKGVMITHQSSSMMIQWACQLFSKGDLAGVLAATSICFDLSIFELFVPLSNGGTVVLAENLLHLPTMLAASRVTLVNTVPSVLSEMLRIAPLPASVQTVNLAGEPLSLSLVQQLYQQGTVQQVLNLYGPTEDTTYSTAASIEQSAVASPVPTAPGQSILIGSPIAKTQAYVLDAQLHLLPIGIPGELYLAGSGLARGYHNCPDLTAERFLPNPFVGTGPCPEPGARIYRTGNLVRTHATSASLALQYLGRTDEQVKLRGLRIELGEIETTLRAHPAVQEAIVILQEQDNHKTSSLQTLSKSKYLIAYVVIRKEASSVPTAPGQLFTPTVSALQEFLRKQLPDYMVPTSIIFLETLPLTPNGKVNRKALPAPRAPRGHEPIFVAPRSEVEQTLVTIWQQVLGLEQVGIHDNFFALGGDSILSLQIIAQARQVGLQKLTPKQLFQYQTIAQLATVAGPLGPTQPAEQAGPQEVEVTGLVPLTPIQHWFFEQALPQPQHFNQAVLLQLSPLGTGLASIRQHLEQIMNALLIQHDSLRLRFENTETGWQQRVVSIAEAGTVSVVQIDLTHGAIGTSSMVANHVQASLDLQHGPLLRTVLFELGHGQPAQLLIVIHHLAVDGVSWRILLSDMQVAMTQLQRGESIALPARTVSFQRWAQHLQELAQETLDKDRVYWLKAAQVPTFPLPVGLAHRQHDCRSERCNTGASARQVHMALTREETHLLTQDAPWLYGSHIHELLLVALLQTLGRWIRTRQIRLDLEGHGREELGGETLDVSRTMGWFTSLYPVLFTLPQESGTQPSDRRKTLSLWIKRIKEQLRSVPQKGISYGLLRYIYGDTELRERLAVASPAQVIFNYLGQFDQVKLRPRSREKDLQLAEQDQPWHVVQDLQSTGETLGPKNSRSHLLDVTALINEGQLHMQWTYSEQIHHHTTIERLASEVVQTLRELLTHYLEPATGALVPSDFPLDNADQTTLTTALLQKETRPEETRTQVTNTSPLVPIQHVGEKLPFFCVHPGFGEVYCFLDLAKHLRQDRPFYGIQAPGLNTDQDLFSSIEEMAATYIDALLAAQPPDAPYFLGGYSFGGLVAFEMARQLQVQGRSVALLALLDSYPDLRNTPASAARANTSSTPLLVKDYAGPIVRMVGSMKHYWEAQVEVSYEDLCLLQPDEQLAYFLDRLRETQVVPDDMDLSQLRRYIQVHEAHDFCLQKYQPQPYAGRITLLRTEQAEHDPSLWTSFSSEPVEVHTVPGNHFSMVVEPYVQSLAVQLQKCLDKADGVYKTIDALWGMDHRQFIFAPENA